MQNDGDLSHINKQIQQNAARIDAERRQADTYRVTADQRRQDGNQDKGAYYEQQAYLYDQRAAELEDENEQLQVNKERTEKRIAELEGERARVLSDHTSRLQQIDQQLANLRGSGLML